MTQLDLGTLDRSADAEPIEITLRQGGKTVVVTGWLERLAIPGAHFVVNIMPCELQRPP